MATVLQLLNLVAGVVILAAAMGSYLRHGVPECAGHHYLWVDLGVPVQGNGTNCVTDTVRGTEKRFYRIRYAQ